MVRQRAARLAAPGYSVSMPPKACHKEQLSCLIDRVEAMREELLKLQHALERWETPRKGRALKKSSSDPKISST
jgi:hypothetical protein